MPENPNAEVDHIYHEANGHRPLAPSAIALNQPPPKSDAQKIRDFLGGYINSDLRPLTNTNSYKARQDLLARHDPLLVAMKYRCPFSSVAKIANSILRERTAITGQQHGSIPEDLPAYLQLLLTVNKATVDAAAKEETAQPVTNETAVEAEDPSDQHTREQQEESGREE